jgi:hypothetical protein
LNFIEFTPTKVALFSNPQKYNYFGMTKRLYLLNIKVF